MEFTNELYHYVQSEAGPRAETLAFAIDTLPEVVEKEPNDTVKNAQRLRLPVTSGTPSAAAQSRNGAEQARARQARAAGNEPRTRRSTASHGRRWATSSF